MKTKLTLLIAAALPLSSLSAQTFRIETGRGDQEHEHYKHWYQSQHHKHRGHWERVKVWDQENERWTIERRWVEPE